MSAPNKDCQKCRSRRIKCDRSLPTCLKCASRSLECPGYSRRIKFVFGGSKKTPNPSIKSDPVYLENKASGSSKGILLDSQHLIIENNNYPLDPRPGNEIQISIAFQESDRTSTHLRPMSRSQLLHHFTNSIASQLVWIDSCQNPWRQFICPLASKSPCVFYAVLAISATNLHVKLDSNSPQKKLSLDISQKYRQKALFLLTHHLSLAHRQCGGADAKIQLQSFRESLATAMLLWHLEMHFPADSTWELHLRTAQALIHRYCQTSVLLEERDRCYDFLLSEFYCATIWPRLTLNIEIEDAQVSILLRNGTDVFIGFVQLMHQIILMTPWSASNSRTDNTQKSLSIADLESQASNVRQAVLAMHDPNSLTLSKEKYADVICVVDAWFYAILIFGYRTIDPSCANEQIIESDRDCLFEALSSLSTPLSFAQNQPWPLFIAGTECIGDKYRQMWIESRFCDLIKFVCPLDRPRMLEFLKEWWARSTTEPGRADCWIEFRQQTRFDKDFVIW